MQLFFQNKRLEKLLSNQKELLKKFGPDNGRRLMRKLSQLAAADHLHQFSTLPATRLHELTGNRKGQLSIDLKHPYRLIIKPDNDPIVLKDDGGIDRSLTTAVKIIEIADTH